MGVSAKSASCAASTPASINSLQRLWLNGSSIPRRKMDLPSLWKQRSKSRSVRARAITYSCKDSDKKKRYRSRELLRGDLLFFQRAVDRLIGADLLVVAFRPSLDGKICRIYARNPALAYYDFAKNVAVYRHRRDEQFV